jgi:hypothetical protein
VGCSSYPLRMGKGVAGLGPLQVIKDHCEACSGDENPKDCTVKGCALWPFRLGMNPNRKGIGNKHPIQANLLQNCRTEGPKNEQTHGVSSASPCNVSEVEKSLLVRKQSDKGGLV